MITYNSVFIFFSTNIGFVEHTELCIRKYKKLVMENSQVDEKYVLTLGSVVKF